MLENARAAALWTADGRCVGVVCEDGRAVRARAVVIATGGTAALWERTTNPPGSQGHGLLLARGAGASLADVELMQFHPTAVTGIRGREGFLVTEAIRGEGATLLDARGERFVEELAPARRGRPRDLDDDARLGRARRSTSTCAASIRSRFPNVVGALRESGLDPATELVPGRPRRALRDGRDRRRPRRRAPSVPGLYAVGESACTGLHGANRLASNSLSECFVFGARAARAALREPDAPAGDPPPAPRLPVATPETRAAVWRYAGLVRDAAGLRGAAPPTPTRSRG